MDTSSPNASPTVQIERETVRQLTVKHLQRQGMFAAEAEIVADRMIEADLDHRSCDGCQTLPEFLDAIDVGDIDPRARTITIRDTSSVAVLDGSSGIGHVVTTYAMQTAIEKARLSGTGTVVVRNSRPAGDLGAIARLAAKAKMIGLVICSLDDTADALQAHNRAWAIPGPAGVLPKVYRERSHPDSTLGTWCGVLSAGLAGIEMVARKRKPLRAANVVEYFLQAIDLEQFGPADQLIDKWKPLWSSTSETGLPAVDIQSSHAVEFSADTADVLRKLATKVKIPVTW